MYKINFFNDFLPGTYEIAPNDLEGHHAFVCFSHYTMRGISTDITKF